MVQVVQGRNILLSPYFLTMISLVVYYIGTVVSHLEQIRLGKSYFKKDQTFEEIFVSTQN